jgi:hypothetical protein
MVKFFSGAGVLLLLAGVYFFIELVTGAPKVGEIIVYPMYIGFALIVALVSFALALLFYIFRGVRRKSIHR